MKKIMIRGAAFALAAVFIFGGTVPALALAREDDTMQLYSVSAADENQGEATLKQRIQALHDERKQQRQQRLEAAKLRVCEQRKLKIKAIINRSIIRAERQEKLFGSIAERVMAFYEKKGKVLTNYPELTAAVDAARTAVETNLGVLKSLEPFDCSADDPKGDIEAHKLALKSVNQSLKEYRTAIKNLIVGVKSVQSTQTDGQEGGQ